MNKKKFTILLISAFYLLYWILVPIHEAGTDYHADCPGCRQDESQSKQSVCLNEFCSNPDGCHNTAHHHHNHPLHDADHCSICHGSLTNHSVGISLQDNVTYEDNCFGLVPTTVFFLADNLVSAHSIRGPPLAA